MNRLSSICVFAGCLIVLAASEPPQNQSPQSEPPQNQPSQNQPAQSESPKSQSSQDQSRQTHSPPPTDMWGARANTSNETIEGLVRDVACPIQNLDNHATSMGSKCVRECVKGGSPLVILTKDDRLYFPISAKMPDADQRQVLMPFVGKYVRASGIVFERAGTHAIVITKIEEMKDVAVKDEE
jgi:hypothetical protein